MFGKYTSKLINFINLDNPNPNNLIYLSLIQLPESLTKIIIILLTMNQILMIKI